MIAFRRQAAYLLDWASIHDANATFWQELVVDDRMPASPSRRPGVGPNCTACRQGMFKDIYTKQQVRGVCRQVGCRQGRAKVCAWGRLTAADFGSHRCPYFSYA